MLAAVWWRLILVSTPSFNDDEDDDTDDEDILFNRLIKAGGQAGLPLAQICYARRLAQ